jgi:hypothetical protein
MYDQEFGWQDAMTACLVGIFLGCAINMLLAIIITIFLLIG